MNPRVKLWLALLGSLVLLGGALGGLYLKKTGENRYEQFYERAAFRAQYFAGLAVRYLDSETTLDGLLGTVFIATDVLYAQIVQQGEVLVTRERLGEFELPVESPARLLMIRERHTSSGGTYWDVLYGLYGEEQSGSSYVRLGLALAPLEQELQRETITVLFMTAIFFGVAAGLLWWLTGFFMMPERQREILSEISSSTGNPVQTDRLEPAVTEALQIDDLGKKVFVNGTEIKLSPKEYDLLKLLASEPGRVFSNEEILQAVWAGRQWATAQDVKQYIYFLRKKLEEDPEQPQHIVTVRGFGYKLHPGS